MNATLIRTEVHTSKYGGKFYYAFFKGEDGKSYRSCLSPTCKNFARWKEFLDKQFICLTNLKKRGKLIDADSFPAVARPDDLKPSGKKDTWDFQEPKAPYTSPFEMSKDKQSLTGINAQRVVHDTNG